MRSNSFDLIFSSFEKEKSGHAFLIETNNSFLCYEDAIDFVKKINCPLTYQKECTECNICLQIDNGNMPSIITVDSQNAIITKEEIVLMKKKLSKNSQFIKYNVYILKDASKLTSISANILLKFLEEPDSNVIAIFITNNRLNVLPTILSRCEVYKNNYQNSDGCQKYNMLEEEYKTYNEISEFFLEKLITNYEYYELKEKLKPLISEKENLKKALMIILENLYLNIEKNKSLKLNKYALITKKSIEKLQYNVNIELLLDNYIVELGDIK